MSHQDKHEISDDSDTQEMEIIRPGYATSSPQCSPPIAKRRKSSPQLDPIPSYTPTPIHLLEERSRVQRDTTKLKADTKCIDGGIFREPHGSKSRVAHQPIIAQDKQNRPKFPVGTAKKVPLPLRAKYLDVIIDEFLNTGHKEEESYERALKEEQSLATRAANKNIYVNLVAGLKKKIRESSGICTKPPEDDTKYVDRNKVVSHDEILTGKVNETCSIQRRPKKACD